MDLEACTVAQLCSQLLPGASSPGTLTPSRSLPLSSLAPNLGAWQLFGFFSFCGCVRVCVCEENQTVQVEMAEGKESAHLQGQALGSSLPKVTQTHHSDNSCCNFIFTREIKISPKPHEIAATHPQRQDLYSQAECWALPGASAHSSPRLPWVAGRRLHLGKWRQSCGLTSTLNAPGTSAQGLSPRLVVFTNLANVLFW